MQLLYDHFFLKKNLQFWLVSLWSEEKVQYFKAADNVKESKSNQKSSSLS